MKKLSIIIPAYNAEPYIDELLKALAPQINPEVEVIVIDDGSRMPYIPSYDWVKVHRQNNGGVSSARNRGLDEAQGEYIAFIDADDLVTSEYVEKIFQKIEDKPDYIYLSWEAFGRWKVKIQLKSLQDEFPPYNLCVWNRVYRRELIGKTRFNTRKKIAEDAQFIRDVELNGKKKAFIPEIVYRYRSDTPDSLTKRFANGQLDTNRIAYYFKHVTADMTHLIKEFKQADKSGEVILLTEQNDIPELKEYAMIMKPCKIKATEKRGEHTTLIDIIEKPIKTQVVIWTRETFNIGGIETFIYSFCRRMCKYYDIIVLYERMDPAQIDRLIPFVEVRKNDPRVKIECDTMIVNRIIDRLPENVTAGQTLQMVHGVRIPGYSVPTGRDNYISVSQAVKDSWELEGVVIPNLTYIEKPKKKMLRLVSMTRLDFPDKGGHRMIKLAKLMQAQGVDFTWLCFSNRTLPEDAPEGMISVPPTINNLKFIKDADYLVQLSDAEAFCYSLVEALELNTAVITTPIGVLPELGIEDAKNGYIVPFDIPDDFDTTKFETIPTFKYSYRNTDVVKKWRAVLGDTVPTKSYKPDLNRVGIKIIREYFDTELNRRVKKGEYLKVSAERAEKIIGAKIAERS